MAEAAIETVRATRHVDMTIGKEEDFTTSLKHRGRSRDDGKDARVIR